jgi:ferric-dicitrate binding protein FerR (iron transport regulator)
MRRDDEMLLKAAVQAVQADEPDATQIAASAKRVAGRLDLDFVDSAIESCSEMAHLLPSYRAGSLSSAHSSLIEAHLRDCRACRSLFRNASRPAIVNWSAPTTARAFVWRPRRFAWALAASFALMVCTLFLYKAYWQVPPGVRAEVQSIDGSAYRISNAGDRPLSPRDKLTEGDHLRTSGGAHAVLRLTDGSTVEVNERSVLGVGARGHNMTITLDNGAVIVQAAKRDSGHLFVKTPDCRVAVTGTVFSVNSGIKGSRVAVLQGSVHVVHAGVDTLIQAGDQMATSDNLGPSPVDQQISWSHDREKYLPLLAQFSALHRRIDQIPFPQLRYSSDLLQRVPSGTLLYISIPNLGDFLSEANTIFHDQLKQSPALQQWWTRGQTSNSADLDSLVEKLHQMSQYLGDEIVIVGVNQSGNPGFAVIADVKQGGLDGFLRKQFLSSNSTHGFTVFDESSLNAVHVSSPTKAGGYALIRQHEAVFSNSIALLKQLNAQLNSGASGFATGDFGQQITAAYSRGAGIILAADVHQMMQNRPNLPGADRHGDKAIENSGIKGIKYLIAEHRELNGQPENHLNLQFAGTRQQVASWLAAPAPMGSLNFITPNAAVAVAVLSKAPKDIADDIMTMIEQDKNAQNEKWSEAEAKLQINFREDLAANLGGEFLLSLDGPVLPTPSWKAVIEVNDSARLEQTLERLLESIRNLAQGKKSHVVAIESSDASGQRFYSIRDVTSGNVLAQYTFADGYMILAPSRALLMQALQTYASGDSLARSAAFKALLPKDEYDNYSAVAYQNLSPVLTPLLSNFSGESAQALSQLAADAKPTAICAWGKDSRIEVASDSRLFGFDLLTLGSLIDSGNKHANANVKE